MGRGEKNRASDKGKPEKAKSKLGTGAVSKAEWQGRAWSVDTEKAKRAGKAHGSTDRSQG